MEIIVCSCQISRIFGLHPTGRRFAESLCDIHVMPLGKVTINAPISSVTLDFLPEFEEPFISCDVEKQGNPDLWGNMIMLWCLQTYYEYTTDPRVIELMTNYFKWQLEYPEEKFLKDRWDTIRAGDNLYSVKGAMVLCCLYNMHFV